jgi:predicted DNA-binding transcriptional regulator YafY
MKSDNSSHKLEKKAAATQPVGGDVYSKGIPTRGSNMPSTTTSTSRSKGEKLALRLSHILALLHQGDVIDKYELAQSFGVDVRTIERDLGERLLGIAERNGDGLWQLTKPARGSIPAKHLHGYAQLVGAAHVFPDTSLSYLLKQLEPPESQRAMLVQPTPHEDVRELSDCFARLQAAIEQHHECSFIYKEKPRNAQPYRLIHKNGVWYLAAEEAGRLKNFSVALIGSLQVDEARRFTPKLAHQRYIESKDDIWFTEATTEVLLRVAPSIAHYFTRRALLPQQQQRLDNDGSLLVTSQINHINQLLPVVRYWLPHVRIIRPMGWQQDLESQLRDYLDQSIAKPPIA